MRNIPTGLRSSRFVYSSRTIFLGNRYTAELVTFAEGASRTDVADFHSKILASTSDLYTGGTYKLVVLEYTADELNDADVLGHDVALRFLGATTSANIDNVQVAVRGGPFDDTVPPTLAASDIVDDVGGATVPPNTPVTFTLNFNEQYILPDTVEASDFGNAGTAPIDISTITEISPGVFTVVVTPTAEGSLQFQVNAGAVISDYAGNVLDTTIAILDDITITVLENRTVPEIVGLPQSTAESAITNVDLVSGIVSEGFHPSIPSGSVISQDPSAGATIPRGSAVDFTVSLGPLVVNASFDANGGTPADPTSKQVSYGESYGTLASTERAAHSFMGWHTSAVGGELIDSATEVTALADHTLYAQWNAHPVVSAGEDATLLLIQQALWTPAQITTVAWYDASDSTTITESAAAVSQWQDKSGNQNHAFSETLPTHNSSDPRLNNLPSIGYDQSGPAHGAEPVEGSWHRLAAGELALTRRSCRRPGLGTRCRG